VTANAPQLQTAQDAMDETHVRAPRGGTILELDAVKGHVISSPTSGGGSVILKLAKPSIRAADSVAGSGNGYRERQPGRPFDEHVDAVPNRKPSKGMFSR